MSEQPQRQFAIQRIYTKDLSFESPATPGIFSSGNFQPEFSVNLNTSVTKLDDNNYEVVLTTNVEAKQEDNVAFMVEVQQAGIFLVSGFGEDEMGPLMGIGAPNALFPYVRELVSDLVTRGSFPQFVLQPVNFEAMYQQQMQAQQDQKPN